MSALSALSGETYRTRTSSGSGAVEPFARQLVESGEERREGLSRAGRRGDERVPAVEDGLPAAHLRAAVGWPSVVVNHRWTTG